MRTRPNRDLLRKTIVAGGASITTPTSFWNLNQSSGSSRTDSCSNPADLTVTGTVTQVSGKISNAASVASGSNVLVNSGNTKNSVSGQFSFCTWFNLNNSAGGTAIANGAGFGGGWKLDISTTHIILTTLQSPSGTTSLDKSVSLSTGTWYFVVGYFNGSQFGLSLDGGSFTTGAGTAPGSVVGIELLNTNAGSNALQGAMDECGYWVGYTLTSTEKDNLYNSGTGKTFNGSSWV